jgi:hypothetical protein
MSCQFERLKFAATVCFQDILKQMNVEEKTNFYEYQAPRKKGVKDFLFQILIQNGYNVNEFLGCQWRDCNKHIYPDCKTIPWLLVTKLQPTMTVDVWAIKLFSEIEDLICKGETDELKFPAPSSNETKVKLLKMLEQNDYKVTEFTSPCNHRCILCSCKSPVNKKYECKYECKYKCGHICSYDASICSCAHWLLISNTNQQMITKVVNHLVNEIDKTMSAPNVQETQIFVPLMKGVKEALFQKLREHEYVVSFDSYTIECLHQCDNNCEYMENTCHCGNDVDSCRCNGQYCGHVCSNKENRCGVRNMIIIRER